MKALLFERSLPASPPPGWRRSGAAGAAARVGPLRLADVDQPDCPAPTGSALRPRLAGICGSDLATVDGRSSRYFEPIVELPVRPRPRGRRRRSTTGPGWCSNRCCAASPGASIRPARRAPRAGPTAARTSPVGHLAARPADRLLRSTPAAAGRWPSSPTTQLHAVPDGLSDEAAVMVEPTACAVHGALTGRRDRPSRRRWSSAPAPWAWHHRRRLAAPPRRHIALIAVAKHPEQRRLARRARRHRGGRAGRAAAGPCGARPDRWCLDSGQLTGGADVGLRLRRQQRLARRRPGGRRAGRHRRAARDARRGRGRPHRTLAAGDAI